MERSTVIISDAHLGAAPAQNEAALLQFLAEIPAISSDLLINGDLFDFWFEYGTVVLSRHYQVLRVLSDLVEAGVRIRLLGGNHDSWGGRFLEDEVGIELIEGPVRIQVGSQSAYVAHGDGLGGGDWGYRALKSVIRSRPARAAFRQIHPDWSARLIRAVSRTESRHGRPDDPSSDKRSTRLRELATRILTSDPTLDLVVFGHCHQPELLEVAPGRHYLNAGDWLHHCTWAEVTGNDVRLNQWSPR
jgi:UDP-2,3-diacylglucosamine hydrolase